MTTIQANLTNPDNWLNFVSETVRAPGINRKGRVTAPIGSINFNAPIGRPIFAVLVDTSARAKNPRWKWGGRFSAKVFTGLGSGNSADASIGEIQLKLNQICLAVFPNLGNAYSCEIIAPNWFPNISIEVWQYVGPGELDPYGVSVQIYNEVRLIN